MDMPQRTFGSSARYGFNGKERDKDMHSLTAYDYGFRIYNPAIGKFLSVDPLTQEYPFYSPYQYAANSPILSVDIDGLEPGTLLNGVEKPVQEQTKTKEDQKHLEKVLAWIPKSNIKPSASTIASVGPTPVHPFEKAFKPENQLQQLFLDHFRKAPGIFKDVVVANMVLEGGPESYMLREMLGYHKPFGDDFINDVYITFKSLGSGMGGYSKYGMTDLNGNPVSYDRRMGAFVNTASLPVLLANPEIGAIEANAAKAGWKVGQPITNLTAKGNVPAWSTVRQRFWKNESFLNGSTYSESNLFRMQKGLAPQIRNTTTGVMESMELHHHIVPQRNGGLFNFIKVTPEQHKLIDPFRR